jgi:uncharacterized protein (TIGR02246 family)
MRKLALLTTIFVVLSAPTHAQDNAAVQKLADQFAEAFNKNAASGVGDLYADDAVLVPPQADIRMGRRDIQAFWIQQAKRAEDLSITVLDVKPLGPEAARAVVRSELTTKGPQPQSLTGRNVVVLQKVGPDWKLATHIWNYSQDLATQSSRGGDDREGRRDPDRDRGGYGDRDRGPSRGREGEYRRDWDRFGYGSRRGDRDDGRYSDRQRDEVRPWSDDRSGPRRRFDRDYEE